MHSRPRPLILILLLVVGVQAWLVWGQGIVGQYRTLAVPALCVLLASAPFIRPWWNRALRWFRRAATRHRSWIAPAVGVATMAYLWLTATWQDRALHPKLHDEFMYLLQARMLANGRLWMPAHPLADFFDTFYVFVEPVYASLCWPGASLLYVPSMWLGLPYWVTSLAAAGVVAGLLYNVVTQVLDGLSGLMAVIALTALQLFRWQAFVAQAQIPILLLALLLLWAWLRWRRSRSTPRAALIGAIAGWAAITRPVDAICICLPIAIATLPIVRHLPVRKVLSNAAAATACAAPFIALQLVFNLGVTGSLTRTPFTYYNDRDQPQLTFGFPPYDPNLKPQTRILQKQIMYEQWVVPRVKAHTWAQAPARLGADVTQTFNVLLPHRLLWVLVPPALLGMFTWSRFAVWGVLPWFLLLYSFYTLFLDHYTLLAAPAVFVLVLIGVRVIRRRWPGMAGALVAGVASLCIISLPQFNPHQFDDQEWETMADANVKIPAAVWRPALVLVRFREGDNVHHEPVYNWHAARIDDNPIILAHDLGARNRELLDYYARRQPQRNVYYYDRHSRLLQPRGTVVEELRQYMRPSTRASAN